LVQVPGKNSASLVGEFVVFNPEHQLVIDPQTALIQVGGTFISSVIVNPPHPSKVFSATNIWMCLSNSLRSGSGNRL
jgi:hypothetical protein